MLVSQRQVVQVISGAAETQKEAMRLEEAVNKELVGLMSKDGVTDKEITAFVKENQAVLDTDKDGVMDKSNQKVVATDLKGSGADMAKMRALRDKINGALAGLKDVDADVLDVNPAQTGQLIASTSSSDKERSQSSGVNSK